MDIWDHSKELKRCVDILESKYKYVSILVQKEMKSYAVSSKKESAIAYLPDEIGFVIRAFNGSKYNEYASDVLNENSLESGIKYLLDIHTEGDDFEILPGDKLVKKFSQKFIIDPLSLTKAEMMKIAEQNKNMILTLSAKINSITVRIGYKIREELFINRNRELHQKLYMFDNVYAIVLGNEDYQEVYGGHIKIGGFEHANLDINLVKKDIEMGERLLTAKKMVPGMYDCIISPGVSGMLAHEAFGHGTESDMFLKNRARGMFYMNKKVASDLITMWDNPDMNDVPEANGSFFFDHDGNLAKKTDMIEKGILLSGITDKYSASKLGIKSTANGRSESYANKVYARMTNTCFEKGSSKLEDMIKSVKSGYFIDKATNGMEDPKGWGMQIQALYAEEIKDGKLTGKVSTPVILTGYVPDILNSVTHVSEDFEISTLGTCGKGHKEWVKVTDGGPYLKLKARLA